MDHCFKFRSFEIFLCSLSLILFSSLLTPEYLNVEQKPDYFTLAPFLFLTGF